MLLYKAVALVKLIMFHSCTIDVFFRYVRIKNLLMLDSIVNDRIIFDNFSILKFAGMWIIM